MKITGIDIGEYRQFKNIKFDFTYPVDHPRAGQPLDKVCFIGQSGTGKTTLLNVIWGIIKNTSDVISQPNRHEILKSLIKDHTLISGIEREEKVIYSVIIKTGHSSFIINNLQGSVVNNIENIVEISYDIFSYGEPYGEFLNDAIHKAISDHLSAIKKFGIYIKDSIAREADAFLFDQKDQPQTFSDFVKTDTQIEKEKVAHDYRINEAGSKKAVSLGDMQSLSTWHYLLREINQYDEETVQQITKIIQTTAKTKVTEELQKWIAADPRIELAEKCLNPILSNFFLEVDDSEKGKVPITLRTRQGIKIDSSRLSTGTRQLLATAIPIYKFDTKDTVILFDEPERSLFPDVQRGLVKYYTSLAPEAQFFFATHSPIIASAFEPCERFILYFDENGEVNFHKGVAPEGDDPNDVLRQDFNMAELMLQKGLEEYERYRQLAMQIRAETDEEKKNQLIVERLELGNRYNFAGQHAQSK